RVLSLPAKFFREYSSGELPSRASSINSLCSMLAGFAFSLGLTSLSSLMYVSQIFSFAPSLVIPSIIIMVVSILLSVFSSLLQIKISGEQMKLAAEGSGLSYAMVTGIQKIKLSGAEKRAYSKWLNHYARETEYVYNPPLFLKINSVLITAVSLIGNIILYYIAVKTGIGQSNYFAFNSSYGLVMGAFTSLASMALSVARVRPILEMAEPILNEQPEIAENKEIITNVRGNIELSNVFFRYDEKSPYIVNNLSLKIKAGEYVAIVGKTGCGKSTLMRLLLGFEKPEKGAIYYDNKDMEKIDLKSLRQKIGTVMQSGGLFQGDIYSNITISKPTLTLDEAWEAAEIAGMADDIRDMPMGMQTMISEGQGGVSGGQKQRIMIARAVAPKPKILFFDEATSALDNKTQRQVSDALDKLKCTRVVIAHRLSTIKNCDRILVLEGGKIIEEGTYQQLVDKNGFFAELVERQRLDLDQ
ncbi:MAG: ATP-binding cassette domain-containing protein, partial [Erysipelotrichaceae bacterium]|nr:ATP-binding cassette domain-containing protein [Erysipelotrichaceae bacterium]